MANIDEKIKILDEIVKDDRYLAYKREARDEYKRYVLAEKQNKYNKVIGTLKRIRQTAVPVFLAGFTVFTSVILLAANYKWMKDDELYEQLNTPLKYYSYMIPKDDNKADDFFEYGTSPQIDNINVILNNSSSGYYISRCCELYGVDPHIMASIMSYEGILNDNMSRDIVEHSVEKIDYNKRIIFELLKNKYSSVSDEQLNNALIFCCIESENVGLNNVIAIINDGELFNNGVFNYNVFKDKIIDLNAQKDYTENIFKGIPSSQFSFLVDGELVNYSLNNPKGQLYSGGKVL